jgi:hypothetical protein
MSFGISFTYINCWYELIYMNQKRDLVRGYSYLPCNLLLLLSLWLLGLPPNEISILLPTYLPTYLCTFCYSYPSMLTQISIYTEILLVPNATWIPYGILHHEQIQCVCWQLFCFCLASLWSVLISLTRKYVFIFEQQGGVFWNRFSSTVPSPSRSINKTPYTMLHSQPSPWKCCY